VGQFLQAGQSMNVFRKFIFAPYSSPTSKSGANVHTAGFFLVSRELERLQLQPY